MCSTAALEMHLELLHDVRGASQKVPGPLMQLLTQALLLQLVLCLQLLGSSTQSGLFWPSSQSADAAEQSGLAASLGYPVLVFVEAAVINQELDQERTKSAMMRGPASANLWQTLKGLQPPGRHAGHRTTGFGSLQRYMLVKIGSGNSFWRQDPVTRVSLDWALHDQKLTTVSDV